MIQIRDSVVLGIIVQSVVVEHLHIVRFVVLLFVKVNDFFNIVVKFTVYQYYCIYCKINHIYQ